MNKNKSATSLSATFSPPPRLPPFTSLLIYTGQVGLVSVTFSTSGSYFYHFSFTSNSKPVLVLLVDYSKRFTVRLNHHLKVSSNYTFLSERRTQFIKQGQFKKIGADYLFASSVSILWWPKSVTAISICSRQFQFVHGNFNLLTAI